MQTTFPCVQPLVSFRKFFLHSSSFSSCFLFLPLFQILNTNKETLKRVFLLALIWTDSSGDLTLSLSLGLISNYLSGTLRWEVENEWQGGFSQRQICLSFVSGFCRASFRFCGFKYLNAPQTAGNLLGRPGGIKPCTSCDFVAVAPGVLAATWVVETGRRVL